MNLKIITVNFCAATSRSRVEALREHICRHDADVILLQEVAVQALDVPGYEAVVNTGPAMRGTAILARESMGMTPMLSLPSGRACAVRIGSLTVINVYAPAGSMRRRERADFYAVDLAPLLAAAGPRIVLAGDFNCVLRDADTTGTTTKCAELAQLVTGLDLGDAATRTTSPDPGHTYITATMSSRLDRAYVSSDVAVQATTVTPVCFSDHFALHVELDIPTQRAPQLERSASWRFDARILKDSAFMPAFAEEWGKIMQQHRRGKRLTEWWLRAAKPAIRSFAAKFTRDWRREKRGMLAWLQEAFHQACTTAPRTTTIAAHIKALKQELLLCHAELAAGAIDKAKLRGELRDEPLSTSHVIRAARRGRRQRIDRIHDADGNVLTDEADIRKHLHSLYEAKFRRRDDDVPAGSNILDAVERTVTDDDNATLCQPFTADEVLAAVKKSPKRKSPGQDGITSEFYVAAWHIIGEALTLVFNDMWARRLVPADMSTGVISLLPKTAQPRTAKDYRPITLLDVDLKIFARLLTARLAVLQDQLLHHNQVRPGGKRSMAGALCDLRDVVSAMAALHAPGCIVSIDFSGAFDAVHHKYVYEVLKRRGVATHFVETLAAMYAGAASRLLVNGQLTDLFAVDRSVRQGCPLSMLLFSVAAAPFLTVLDRRLSGLQLARCTLRVSAYADDAFLVLRRHDEAAVVTEVLQQFAAVSGLVANPAKCGALAAGDWDTSVNINFPYVDKLKVLGVQFTACIKTTINLNWEMVVHSVQGVLRENACRAFGLSQRAEYVRTYALAKLWHVAQVLPATKAASKAVVKAVSYFLWRGYAFRTSMAVACTAREHGGLGIPAVHNKCLALFTGRWQGILVDTEDAFAAEWLHTLLGAFPIGQGLRRLWAAASHFAAFHATRTTAADCPPDVPARTAIRGIYAALVSASPAEAPRVARKRPTVEWHRVWANINDAVLTVPVRDSWWTAVHDLVATRRRLHRTGRNDTVTCPRCGGVDTLRHRVTTCGGARTAWCWLRTVLANMLGRAATARDVLLPDFEGLDEERRVAAVWATGQLVNEVLQGGAVDPRSFAVRLIKEKKAALDGQPDLQKIMNYVQ